MFSFSFIEQGIAQNADVTLLKKITTSRNLRYEKFHEGISFSVYPALVIAPGSYLTLGLIQKDTNMFRTGLCIASGIAINLGLTYGLKYAIARTRPYDAYKEIIPLDKENSPSMPSGHTSSAFNVATSITLFIPKWYVAVPAFAWASGVAYSRMYIGVHYPSDIIAGAILGSGTAWLTYYLNKKLFRKK